MSRPLVRLLTLLLSVVIAAAASPQGAGEPGSLYARIALQLQAEDGKGAVTLAEQAVKSYPNDSDAYLWLGRAYGRRAMESSIVNKLGWAKKCKAAWEQAVKLDPRNSAARLSLVEYNLQAPGVAGGDVKQARAQADALLAYDPVRGNIAWAQIHARDKDTTATRRSLEQAVAAEPPDSTLAKSALSTWCVDHGDAAAARAVWQPRLRQDPGDLYARYQLGRIAAISGEELDAGIVDLQAYLAGTPKPGWPPKWAAQWRLGLAYEKQGRKAQAVAALEEARRMAPDDARVKKDLERVRKAK